MSSHANICQPLAWDSDYLGFEVARLELSSIAPEELAQCVAQARGKGLRLLYLIAAPDDAVSNASARRAGAWLADRKVTFAMPVAPAEQAAPISPAIRPTTTWMPQLESLALQSGEYSRFRLDSNFAPTVFTGLYKRWLQNSLSHQIAREVLAFDAEGNAQAQGLLTLGLKNGRADIGLLAVDAQARGQRIGQQLVAAARQRTAAWGLAELQVVTQLDNEPACGFYRRCGFSEWQVEHIYHLWL
ncbi:GNAT family N-acetyltransferase [Hymenobacter monticola]|uniref:GNAT family N-acetyltransferase n=1 Tax=Hymenobacter monticola TaxID=1705399 RepID=A0ABY4AYA1_9BACT|nr:GNAT family N-acetyltransferase [Hymenobacter monticola]UOE31868.1 GNAT family N-acetyltransferase [Hymenobacter monticola]